MVNKGNHLQMAELFRLVKYYNLPIYIYRTSYYGCRQHSHRAPPRKTVNIATSKKVLEKNQETSDRLFSYPFLFALLYICSTMVL
jgi:hypothetical protein